MTMTSLPSPHEASVGVLASKVYVPYGFAFWEHYLRRAVVVPRVSDHRPVDIGWRATVTGVIALTGAVSGVHRSYSIAGSPAAGTRHDPSAESPVRPSVISLPRGNLSGVRA